LKIRTTAAALLLSSSACFAQAAAKQNTAPGTQKPAQTAPVAKQNADADAKPTAPAANVPEDAVVITIPGDCAAGTAASDCTTKITRGAFEKLLNAMNPNIPAEARRSIASSYGQLLAMAGEAQRMGVDKDPSVQIQMRVQGMSLMAQALQKKIFENSKPTAADVQKYYSDNSAKYEEFQLRRIVVLKSASSGLRPEEMKALADKIRDRAVAGEDPDKLEAEAFKDTKAAGSPPSTNLGWKRRGGMDPRHEPQILALKTGEVSPVMEDGQAYYIYKVDTKRAQPLESVEKDIQSTLQTERAQKALRDLLDNSKPQLNDAYFGPEPPKTMGGIKATPEMSQPPKQPK
jgi:peptidyl-prolyl cis-trans isomerase C